MKSVKKVIVIGVAVLIPLLMQIESFADEDWEVITQLSTDRWGLRTAVVDYKLGRTESRTFYRHITLLR